MLSRAWESAAAARRRPGALLVDVVELVHAQLAQQRDELPMVQPAHLRQSRGLGKILMLLAAAKSEPRETREAAAKLLEAVAEKREQASVQFAE